jgi:DNA-binding MarR family transcriptional regulator
MKLQKELVEELSEAFQRANTLMVLHTNAIANRIGLSATEFEAMDIISRNQPITAGRLAEYCGLTTGAITGIVDRLERGEFVRRERDPEDRRRVFIVPVENAARSRKVRALYKPMTDRFNDFASRHTTEEICFLVEMQKVANHVTEQAIIELRKK